MYAWKYKNIPSYVYGKPHVTHSSWSRSYPMKAWGRRLIGLHGRSWLVFRTDRESQRGNVNRSHVIRLNTTPEQYASSKTCSGCSWINDDLTLAERVFICHDCGLVIDRDHNAASNIRKEALRLITDVPVVASSERKIACGAESAGSAMSETFCDEAGTKVL
jgi:hypothetical protein